MIIFHIKINNVQTNDPVPHYRWYCTWIFAHLIFAQARLSEKHFLTKKYSRFTVHTLDINIFEKEAFPDLASHHTEQRGRDCTTVKHLMGDRSKLVVVPRPSLRDHAPHTSVEGRLLECPEEDGLLNIVGGVALFTGGGKSRKNLFIEQ